MGLIRFLYGRNVNAIPLPDATPFETDALTVRYPGASTPAIENVSVTVGPASLVALVGPNGAGKSTLLKAAAGLLKPSAGVVHVFGRPAGVFRSQVAYLPQRGEVDWRFPISVRRLVLTGRYVHCGWLRRPARHDAALADQSLARLGLTGLAGSQIGRLSGGQQQRALLARALVQQARLLLLDEPLNGVDAATRDVIMHTLSDLRHAGAAVMVATHDHDRRAGEFDAVIRLENPHSMSHIPQSTRSDVACGFPSKKAIEEPGDRDVELGARRWSG
ncbi:MAG: metal ABC transporter ATP-binding protein [Dehalococcoidia bacterium]